MYVWDLVCRFGSSHIKDNFNVVNEELWREHENKQDVINTLSDDVSSAILKLLNKNLIKSRRVGLFKKEAIIT